MEAGLGDFEFALAAAAGNDAMLRDELRTGFVRSLDCQLDLLGRARCDGNWQLAAERLKGLGATFHSMPLVALAEEALAGAPGDPVVMRKLARWRSAFSAAV